MSQMITFHHQIYQIVPETEPSVRARNVDGLNAFCVEDGRRYLIHNLVITTSTGVTDHMLKMHECAVFRRASDIHR